MKKSVWERRIPTILALIIVAASVFVTSALIQSGVLTVGRASLDTAPQNISISNVTDTSFTVTFVTHEKVAAAVTLDDFGSLLVLDDRDKSLGTQQAHYSHFITVPNLKSKTSYQFSIISNSSVVLDGNKKFTVTTGEAITTPRPTQKAISGTVLLPDSSPASDTLITITIPGAEQLSAITNNAGEYIIQTNSLRDSALSNYISLSASTKVSLDAARKDLKSHLDILYRAAGSIPPITLTRDYNFLEAAEEIPLASESSALKIPVPINKTGEVKIIAPVDHASLIDSRPSFSGTALPGQKVKITIHSDEHLEITVIADNNGFWSFRPQTPLSSGSHTVTIEAQDRFGIVRRIQQSFTIFPQGTQVEQSATPSATPIPTRVPTAFPTSVPTTIPTAIPTGFPTVAPTPIPTQIPTVAPTSILPTSFAVVTPTPPLAYETPVPTGNISSVLLTFVSVLFILTGTSLLFLLG